MDPRPWLSHDFFKQANEAFNSPSRMPQRPILQITKLDAIKVRYSEKDIKTIRLVCADGGLNPSTGAIVLQPDMADPSKVNEEGFGLKIGYAVILLAFRLQQTNEKKKRYLRVSDLLVIDSMTHLQSQASITVPQRFDNSSTTNNTCELPMGIEAPDEDQTGSLPPNVTEDSNIAASPSFRSSPPPPAQELWQKLNQPSITSMASTITTHTLSSRASNLMSDVEYPEAKKSNLSTPRITSSMGYLPNTAENLISLRALESKATGSYIDCIAVITEVFPIRTRIIGGIQKQKRDVRISDPSVTNWVILSVWRDINRFDPRIGDIILLKQVSVHPYQGRSLNAYDGSQIVLNPERDDCLALREWWDLKELERNGGLAGLDDDMDI